MLQCVAEHAQHMPPKLRHIINKSVYSDKALEALESVIRENELLKSEISTTQAIDLIGGGVKSNALPELAWAVINHRISVLRYDSYIRKPLSQ